MYVSSNTIKSHEVAFFSPLNSVCFCIVLPILCSIFFLLRCHFAFQKEARSEFNAHSFRQSIKLNWQHTISNVNHLRLGLARSRSILQFSLSYCISQIPSSTKWDCLESKIKKSHHTRFFGRLSVAILCGWILDNEI